LTYFLWIHIYSPWLHEKCGQQKKNSRAENDIGLLQGIYLPLGREEGICQDKYGALKSSDAGVRRRRIV
jgi:hypothetical protein